MRSGARVIWPKVQAQPRRHGAQPMQLIVLTKLGFQLLESFLEYFGKTVFDQINLIDLHIQRPGDLGGRDLLDGLDVNLRAKPARELRVKITHL